MASRATPLLPQYERKALRPTAWWRSAIRYALLVLLGAFYGLMVSVLPPQLLIIPAMPIFIMLALILWMLPDIADYPEHTLDRWTIIFFLLLFMWPSYIAMDLPGLPWISFTRMAQFVLFAAFLYGLATSSPFRKHMATVARSSPPIFWFVVTYIIIQIVTLPFSQNLSSSFNKVVNNQIYLTAIFFLGCWYFSKAGTSIRLIKVLLIATIFVCLLCIPERINQQLLWANHIPSFMQVDPVLLSRILGDQARAGDGIYRVRGTFPISLSLAEFLSFMLPFLIHLIVTARDNVQRYGLLAAYALVAVAIYLTNTRLGAIGFVLSHVGYSFMWGMRRWRTQPESIAGPSLVLMFPALMAAMVLVILSSTTLTTKLLGGGQHRASNNAREAQWDMMWPKLAENPLGHGAGMSGNTLQYYNRGGAMTVDSHFITTLLDFGVIGFVALYGMAVYAAWLGYKLFSNTSDREVEYAGPAAIALANFFVIKSVLSQEDNHIIPFLFVAMILALRARDSGLVTARPPARPDG